MTWYYVQSGEAAGPISDGELLSRLQTGSLLPSTLVWRKGMADWQAASEVVPKIQLAPPVTGPVFSPASSSFIEAPPELTSGTPPVLPNFFCTYCGNIIPADQLVRIGGRNVCAACKPAYVQQVTEGIDAPLRAPVLQNTIAPSGPMMTGPETDLADPTLRLVGYLLDLLFIAVPAGIIFFVFFIFVFIATVRRAGTMASNNEEVIGFAFIGLIALTVGAMLLYWTFFIGARGATPGMKIMKLKMVRADRTPIGYARAFGHALLLYVINLFTMGLTNITAFFDQERRTVVDMMCDTRVVRE